MCLERFARGIHLKENKKYQTQQSQMTPHKGVQDSCYTLPYERFFQLGPQALTDTELLAIIIRTGYKGNHALDLAKAVMDKTNGHGLQGLSQLELEDYLSIKGIGEVKAIKLKCIFELSRRLSQTSIKKEQSFPCPNSIANYYMERMKGLSKEHFYCMFFDTSMGFIKDQLISIGTVNSSLVSTREIFLEALQCRAVNFVMVHNHPSGHINPSQADIDITTKAFEASNLMDIQLRDHLIIGDDQYFSFLENNLVLHK